MSDLYKTLLISRPQVLSSGGSGLLTQANNLSDVADAATARANLGVSSTSTQAINDSDRKKEGFLYSDGTTTSRAQAQTPGTRGNLAGAPLASWVGWVDVPSSNPSVNAHVAKLASNTTSDFTANGLAIYFVSGSAGLTITAPGATLGTDFRNFSNSTFRTTYSGQRIWLDVKLTNGSATNPVVYVNGGDVSSSFSLSTGGSAPDWLSSSLSVSNFLTGYGWPAGIAPLGSWLNSHLTNAESDAWRTSGRPPAWVQFGGSAVNATGDATLTTDSAWQDSNGKFVVSGGSIVGTNVAQFEYIGALATSGARILTAGSRVRWKVVVSAISGGNNFVLQQGGNGQTIQAITAATTYSGTYTATVNDNTVNPFVIKNFSATASGITITSIEWFVDGALSLPSVQSINVVEDTTALGGNQARLVGNAPIVLDNVPVSVIERPAEAYTTTSIQLLGGAVSGSRKRRIVSVTGNSSASVNLSLGTTTSGTQLVNAQAVNGDFDISTFASRIVAAGSSLFLTFSGSTTASIHIHFTDL